MAVQNDILEIHFQNFVEFLKEKGEKFEAFRTSPYIDKEENYKYEVVKDAKESLGQKRWKPADIGTGRIQASVKNAIKTKVIYAYVHHNNNLVDWRKRDDFAKLPVSSELEELLFNFYKNKIGNEEAFRKFLEYRLSYQLIAYLFFIKDHDLFLPITQERFDEIFELIGIPEFKTSGQASWANYRQFIDIIKQVRTFLRTKDQQATLLDAHSFLYILGSQMKEENFYTKRTSSVATDDQPRQEEISESKDVEEGDIAVSEDVGIKSVTLLEIFPDELPEQVAQKLIEGAKKTVTVNAYERNAKARQLCIDHWKAICAVCDFDFEKVYGDLGRGFIHVHHLKEISKIGKEYQVDPIKDLRPVCPNCHAMLHRYDHVMAIDDLKRVISENQKQRLST